MFLAAFTPPEVGPVAAGFALAALLVVGIIVAVSWILLPWIIVSKLNAQKRQTAASTSAVIDQLVAVGKKIDSTNTALASLLEAIKAHGPHPTSEAEAHSSENTYYFVRDGKTEGPINEAAIRKLFHAGVIGMETPAMKRGGSEWRTIHELFPS